MIKHITLICLLSLAGTMALSAQTVIPKSVKKHLKKASGDAVRKHIAYLADDQLKGRLPGTPEYKMAVEYVENELKKMNIQPAGENGTYRQAVTIKKATAVPEQSSLTMVTGDEEEQLIDGEDYFFMPDLNATTHKVKAKVVLVGHGISAPELDHDDYEGVDAKGKVVVVLFRSPEGKFGSAESAHFSNLASKIAMAQEQGAVGIVFLPPPSMGNILPLVRNNLGRTVSGIAGPSGRVSGLMANSFPQPQRKFLL